MLLCWAAVAFADVAVPPLTGRVVDQTGTLDSSDIAALNQKLADLETRKGSQVAVLIVPTTEPETIEQYSIRVADAWKIGRKKIDDGALFVVAKNDRHLRIEVGYGLEGALTDVTTKRIIDEDITPRFKSGDFAGGISAGIDRIIRVINGEPLPAPEPPHWVDQDSLINLVNPFNPFVIIAVLVAGAVLRQTLGRLLGSAATGGIVGFIIWLFAGSIAIALLLAFVTFVVAMSIDASVTPGPTVGRGRHSRGGAWGGGWSGGGGWSSGSSGGGGDFSGGGGSFGGGGASGSW
jgi:uncharacterized protein